jgi:NADP-dependent 3-hydroxy acid dehydrogenase YdfG
MTFSPDALKEKTVLVTGASSGIGRAVAVLASQCGARVVLSGRSEQRLDETSRLLAGEGHSMHPLSIMNVDATADAIRMLAQTLGPLDGIFHGAGVGVVRPIRMTKQANVEEVFAGAVNGAIGSPRPRHRRM